MAAGNRIHAKAYRDKMRGVADELRRLVARARLDMRQRRYLYQRMNEYKMLHEGGIGAGFQNENSTNSVENSWCPKDTSTALREKTEALAAMQKAADDMSKEIQTLRAKRLQISLFHQRYWRHKPNSYRRRLSPARRTQEHPHLSVRSGPGLPRINTHS